MTRSGEDAAESPPMGDRRQPRAGIRLPEALAQRLARFRLAVRRRKLVEASCIAAAGVAAAYLLLVASDRLGDTSGWVRGVFWTMAVASCAVVPLAIHRWVWHLRRLDDVARLVGRSNPRLGDELLGVVELARESLAGSPARSSALCAAAHEQVAGRVDDDQLRAALPAARPWTWAALAAVPVSVATILGLVVPAAAGNAWARLAMPWRSIARYTFTRLEPLPPTVVVPHGEGATVECALVEDSLWRPRAGRLRVGRQRPLVARRSDDQRLYRFDLPPSLEPSSMLVAAGDARQRVILEPTVRPDIQALEAEIALPVYLARPRIVRQDVRGGSVAAVAGSVVSLRAVAGRELAEAEVDGQAAAIEGRTLLAPPIQAEGDRTITITWRDRLGLSGQRPLEVRFTTRPDAAPTVTTTGLPASRSILLDVDTLTFSVLATDDFGVRQVGIEWTAHAEGGGDSEGPPAADGELVLRVGGPEAEALDAVATFSPRRLGIRPRTILLWAFVEDFLPGRPRVRSAPVMLYVVDQAEHAFIINEQLNRWRQQAGEVRDREMALLATNRELRDLSEEALDGPAAQARIESQAAAEMANARRLERLVDEGGDLVREAVKNPEFEADLLEALAADIESLAAIAGERMPGVADLLRLAALGEPPPPDGSGATPPGATPPGATPPGATPPQTGAQQAGADSPAAGGLPTTQAGAPPEPPSGPQPGRGSPAVQSLDAAIAAQQALLEEFAKVGDQLADVMARLEGSTFVKRFKLASREQAAIGGRIVGLGGPAFGRTQRQPAVRRVIDEVVEWNAREAERVSNLMDDLQAYFDRRRLPAFRTVLEEMQSLDTLGSLRQLTDDIRQEAGMSIAQAEYWSDTFDRLADELVPAAEGEGEAGEGETGELPPELVLEAMRILEGEVLLREETRVVEQIRDAAPQHEFAARAAGLAAEQEALGDRTAALASRLVDLPEGRQAFAGEIRLFDRVEEVMREAAGMLRSPDTGPAAIGAETEAIELLLATQAAGGGGGSGGAAAGAVAGGGGTGSARVRALANLGRGNRSERPAGGGEQSQATGAAGRELPEEFRGGLDVYFNRFEKERP
jgi:hypothetical protein